MQFYHENCGSAFSQSSFLKTQVYTHRIETFSFKVCGKALYQQFEKSHKNTFKRETISL